MHRLLRGTVLITYVILIICIISGCADDDPTESGEIKLLATMPRAGGTLSATGELLMIFDGFPASVTVDGKEATVHVDKTAIVQGADLINARTAPKKTFIIRWTNLDNSFVGTQTVTFSVLKAPITVEVDPAPGGRYIRSNTGFTLTFDQPVRAVAVNDTPAVGSGRNWKVAPRLWEGPGQDLDIKWINRDGSTGSKRVGPYAVEDNGGYPAEITSGTVADGAADVDPGPINAGGFRFDFDEPVTGTITLTDEVGADLNWIGIVQGYLATLTLVAGQELVHDTIYKIEIDVQDGAGNGLQVTITFVTKPK